MKQYFTHLSSEFRILVTVTLLSSAAIGATALWHGSSGSPDTQSDPSSGIDTFIPKGFVLIPIDVQNYEALDSILGKHGIVDLFRGQEAGGQLLARNVRILRAPQNPSRFAVLVEESQASRILNDQGRLFVVVKPPSRTGTEFVNQKTSRRRIVIEGE